MRKTFAVFFLFLLNGLSTVQAEPELKGNATELSQYLASVPKTVLINGEAELRVPADQAVVTLKVTTENRSLQEALRLNQDVRNRLSAYLKNHAVPNERIRASRFSSTPKFGLFGEKAKSYRVENLVRVVVQDEHEFQVTAAVVDSFPEVQFTGAEFEHKEKETLKEKAIAQACNNAGQRRKLFEEKLGVTLKVEKFSGGAVAQNTPLELRRRYAMDSYSSKQRGPYAVAASPPAASVSETAAPLATEDVSSFGELVYTVEVVLECSVHAR